MSKRMNRVTTTCCRKAILTLNTASHDYCHHLKVAVVSVMVERRYTWLTNSLLVMRAAGVSLRSPHNIGCPFTKPPVTSLQETHFSPVVAVRSSRAGEIVNLSTSFGLIP